MVCALLSNNPSTQPEPVHKTTLFSISEIYIPILLFPTDFPFPKTPNFPLCQAIILEIWRQQFLSPFQDIQPRHASPRVNNLESNIHNHTRVVEGATTHSFSARQGKARQGENCCSCTSAEFSNSPTTSSNAQRNGDRCVATVEEISCLVSLLEKERILNVTVCIIFCISLCLFGRFPFVRVVAAFSKFSSHSVTTEPEPASQNGLDWSVDNFLFLSEFREPAGTPLSFADPDKHRSQVDGQQYKFRYALFSCRWLEFIDKIGAPAVSVTYFNSSTYEFILQKGNIPLEPSRNHHQSLSFSNIESSFFQGESRPLINSEA